MLSTFLRRSFPQSSVLFAWSLQYHCRQISHIHKLATITNSLPPSFSVLLYVTKLLAISKYIQGMYM